MTFDEVMAEFRDAGALLEGHFILSYNSWEILSYDKSCPTIVLLLWVT